ncbi:ribbon-helix-helix protein, CopG family [Halovivax sp.]|nr:ribbon-helix-helix protein, CopG family [Halovivax sp.]
MEECRVDLADDLAADLDVYCRTEHVHRDEAIRRLLEEWLERKRGE